MEKDIYLIRETLTDIHRLMEEFVMLQSADRNCCRAVTMPDAALLPQKPEEPTESIPETLSNRKEAADFLLVDPRTVTRYRINGKLRFVLNDDGQIRYRREDLQACYFWKWGKNP
ncbi:helix-turn-helix domain-containing protein [Parapedobacter soli]|uniref:helix-turn-helix domain-containing protein n=1 Tax=Parapedobacter soli TaxID=416955 RepID=UPI0021C9F8B9|nr:helix-turn-helix domain-containing protein [Parapedobacter soli]